MKIGLIAPTCNRPHWLRHTVLQMQNQSLKPDIMAIHQNGLSDSYEWAIKDLKTDFHIHWIHSRIAMNTAKAYEVSLKYLLAQECTHYFWIDDDDIYFNTHIEESVNAIDSGYDFTVNSHSQLLKVYPNKFQHTNSVKFMHSPGGQCSSMCFNKEFATQLYIDFVEHGPRHVISDQVVAKYTIPKFNCLVRNTKTIPTTAYVCHSGTQTSSQWLDK